MALSFWGGFESFDHFLGSIFGLGSFETSGLVSKCSARLGSADLMGRP